MDWSRTKGRWMARWVPWACVAAAATAAMGPAGAQSAAPVQAQQPAAPVFTRARLVSIDQESDGKRYVRLKLLPRAKIPFTTQTFRVTEPALLAVIPEGAWVKFTARRINGENTLTAIHVVEECPRFQHCD